MSTIFLQSDSIPELNQDKTDRVEMFAKDELDSLCGAFKWIWGASSILRCKWKYNLRRHILGFCSLTGEYSKDRPESIRRLCDRQIKYAMKRRRRKRATADLFYVNWACCAVVYCFSET